jgi:acetylornithine deacetylase/succinyl-diaminopimelate desuccinylase-like protein
MTTSLEQIHAHINEEFDGRVTEIQRFIGQPGFSHTGEGIRETAEMCREYVAALGAADAQLVETDRNPVVFGTVKATNPDAKTLIGYSLYDVVPVKEEEWTFPPLAADLVDSIEVGLPASFGMVLESIQDVTGDLPINVMFAWEAEEEIGCPHLDQFVESRFSGAVPQPPCGSITMTENRRAHPISTRRTAYSLQNYGHCL